MNIQWRDHIVSSPDVIRGKPRIKGTRIPVSLILGYLAANKTPDDIITEFPDLKKDNISACLDYAREFRPPTHWPKHQEATTLQSLLKS